MSKFYNYINENTYNNWTFPDDKTLKSDFEEYKKKENNKWKSRSQSMGFKFPIFSNFEEFKFKLKNADIIKITDKWVNKITHLTNIDDLEELKSMVKSYKRPRDIESIISGFENNDKIPYPIILKGNNGYHIMAGNTRINIARIMNITPEALLVDVSKKK